RAESRRVLRRSCRRRCRCGPGDSGRTRARSPERAEGQSLMQLTPVLSDNWDTDRPWTLDGYGDYAAARKALAMDPDALIQLVKDSGLRGRGGAGFPTGYSLEVVVHVGAGAYICGEETALLDSLEGYRGQPRLRPPFPAVAGLYASPTVINNVESIASVPAIVDKGVDWFRGFGSEKSP